MTTTLGDRFVSSPYTMDEILALTVRVNRDGYSDYPVIHALTPPKFKSTLLCAGSQGRGFTMAARVALRIHNISPCHTCLTEGIGAYLNKKWVEVKRAAQEER